MFNIFNHYRYTYIHFIFFLSPLFFLVIKSWLNIFLVLLFLISTYRISKRPAFYLHKRGTTFIASCILLLSPFLCELIVQLLRQNVILSSLDGPSRFLMGLIIYVYLSRNRNILCIIKFFMTGCIFALVFTFISIMIFDEYYWDGRAATYFVDPNSLPVYSGLLYCFSMYRVKFFNISILKKTTIYFFTTIIYLFIIHQSLTRTVWLPAMLFMLFFIYNSYSKRTFILSSISIIASIYLFYLFNDIFKARLDDVIYAFSDINADKLSSSTSTISLRLNIFLAVIELIKMEPFLGFQDGMIPPFEILKAKSQFLNLMAYEDLKYAGSHFEITAQLLRKGLFFGSVTILATFILPLYLLHKKKKSKSGLITIDICSMFICLLFMLFTSSFGIEVFNLKMYSSFWAICLALMCSLVSCNEDSVPISSVS